MTLQLSGTLATNHKLGKPGARGEGQGVGGCGWGDTNEPTNEPFDLPPYLTVTHNIRLLTIGLNLAHKLTNLVSLSDPSTW